MCVVLCTVTSAWGVERSGLLGQVSGPPTLLSELQSQSQNTRWGNTFRRWSSVVLGNLGSADIEHRGQSVARGPHTDNPSTQEAEAGACGKSSPPLPSGVCLLDVAIFVTRRLLTILGQS